MSPFFMPCYEYGWGIQGLPCPSIYLSHYVFSSVSKKLFQDIFIKPHILIIQCRYFSNDQTLGDIQVDMITYERYNYRKVGKRYLISYTEKPIPYFLHRKLMPYFLRRKIIPYFLHSVESCSCDLLNQECMMLFLHFQCFCL